MKKIAFVTLNDNVPWGGSEVFWSELAGLCNADGIKTAVSLAHWDIEPDHIKKLRKEGSEVFYRFPEKKYKPLPFHKKVVNRFLPAKFGFKRSEIPQARKFDVLNVFKPDIVFLSIGNHYVGHGWVWELNHLNIPYIIVNQLVKGNAWMDCNTENYFHLRNGYLKAKEVLFTSYENEKLMAKYLFAHFDNAKIINNPIKKIDEKISFPKKEKFCFAIVASLSFHHKAQDILLDAIRSPKWQNRNVEFNFYGKGHDEDLLKKLIEYWEIKNVTIHGFEKIEKIWNENHILVMPSRYEGLSLSFLEAMNCSRTAIVTNVGDTTRFIDDNENGFIIKGCEVELVDEALERAWEKRNEWEAMGKKANEKLHSIIKEDPLLSYYRNFKKSMNIN